MMNVENRTIFEGDNLHILRGLDSETMDLIYLDPPFNSNRTYNAIYKDETGRPLPDQIEAFCDLWTLDNERQKVIRKLPKLMVSHGIDNSVLELQHVTSFKRFETPRFRVIEVKSEFYYIVTKI